MTSSFGKICSLGWNFVWLLMFLSFDLVKLLNMVSWPQFLRFLHGLHGWPDSADPLAPLGRMPGPKSERVTSGYPVSPEKWFSVLLPVLLVMGWLHLYSTVDEDASVVQRGKSHWGRQGRVINIRGCLSRASEKRREQGVYYCQTSWVHNTRVLRRITILNLLVRTLVPTLHIPLSFLPRMGLSLFEGCLVPWTAKK